MNKKTKDKFNAAKIVLQQNKYEDLNKIHNDLEKFIENNSDFIKMSTGDLSKLEDALSDIFSVLQNIQLEAVSHINKCYKPIRK